MAAKSLYIPTLDGWRAIAIGLVLGAHSAPILEGTGVPALAKLAHLFSHAGVGVDIFFALSGYLICTLLLNEKQKLGGRIDLGRFYTRRAFRILPPIVAYLVALLALHAAGRLPQVGLGEMFGVLAFVRNYAVGSWYTGHFWSLAIEEQFYLVIPLMLAVLGWRPALAATLALSACCAIWRVVEYRYGIVDARLPWTLFEFRTENRIDGLMNGAILALLLHRPEIRAWFTRVLTPRTTIALLAAAVALDVAFTSAPARRTVPAVILPLVVAFTVLRPETLAGRFLELRPIRWVGRLSFSLYIWQQLFLIPYFIERSPGPIGPLQRSLVSILPAMACAVASYYLVERPMFRIGHRLAASPATPATPDHARPPETDAAVSTGR